MLYYALGGENWDDATNWNSKYDVCTWYGVGCDGIEYGTGALGFSGEGIVTHIQLSDNSLRDKLPGDLAGLAALTAVELRSNSIEGTAPPAVYTMSSLLVLFLDDNYLTGSISSDIGKTNLSRLTLSDNEMTGSIPDELGDVKSLVLKRWLN
jgi:hypothetical protein